MALPGLIIVVLGSSLNNVIIAIVIEMFAPVLRTVRSQVLSLKELDYILAAKANGAYSMRIVFRRIVFRHIAPNCLAIYLILATFYLGTAIIIEASLSFLGVGAPAHVPSWGGMRSRAAQERLQTAPWVAIFPGLAIFIVVLGFNLLGDALQDVFDPKLTRPVGWVGFPSYRIENHNGHQGMGRDGKGEARGGVAIAEGWTVCYFQGSSLTVHL